MKRKDALSVWILYSFAVFSAGAILMAKKAGCVISEKQYNVDRFQKLFQACIPWVEKKQHGKTMKGFLKKNGYHSIAIYGLGGMGKLLAEELKGYAEVCYGVDRRDVSADFPVYEPDDILPDADAVIVTPVYEFEKIEETLRKKLDCPVYSIEDIIYFMD